MLLTALVLGRLCDAANGKTSEKASATSPPKEQPVANMFADFVDLSKLDVVDLLRSEAVLIGFIFAFLSDKRGESRVWQLAESVFLGLYGLATYIFPSLMLGYRVVGTVDHLHVYLSQAIGASYVALAVVSHRQYHTSSKDPQVTGGWLLSRAVGFTFLMVNGIYAKLTLSKETQRFTDQSVVTGSGVALLWIGSMVKLWQHHNHGSGGGSSSRGKTASVLNPHLMVAIMIMLPSMFLHYGMTEFLMNTAGLKYDKIHVSLVKSLGAIGLTFIIQEITALQYESDGDKRNLFFGDLVLVSMVLPLMLLNQYWYSLYAQQMFITIITVWGLHCGNSLCAAFIRMKDKKY